MRMAGEVRSGPVGPRRLLLVIAGPGYGKTRLLRNTLPPGQHWYDQASIAGLAGSSPPVVPAALLDRPARPEADGPRAWLVLDDVPRLDRPAAAALGRWLAGLPAHLGAAITARWPMPDGPWPWPSAEVDRVGPTQLRLSRAEVAAVLRDECDLHDPELAGFLHEATTGWPALVRLGGSTLAAARAEPVSSTRALVAALTRRGTPVTDYLLGEILPSLGDGAPGRRLLGDLAGVAPITADLARALGHRGAARILAELTAVGVLWCRPDPVRHTDPGTGPEPEADPAGSLQMVPVVAALAGSGRTPARVRATAQVTAAWYTEHGPPLAAARAQLGAGHPEAGADLLAAHGEQILAGGAAPDFVELVEALPAKLRSWRIRLLWADGYRAAGDTRSAEALFAELAESTPDGHGYPPELAWRMGMVHYLRAEPRAALDAFERADLTVGPAGDRVQVLAWTAAAHWMLGEADAAGRYARQALGLAAEAGDPRALVCAHVAMAMSCTLSGEQPGRHYEIALRGARQLGDVVQATRILINQTDDQLSRARYDRAFATARQGRRTAEAGAPAGMVIVALCNEAEALGRLGHCDEAVERYARVVSMCQRLGIRRAAAALVGSAEVHRRRGWPMQARAALEEAVRLARGTGEIQALVPALAGLARVLARDEPTRAEALATEAAGLAEGPWLLPVYLAEGWVALHRGELTVAAALARQATEEARLLDQPARLAEALELTAATLTDPEAAVPVLREAHRIWRDGGATIDADRITVTLGGLPGAGTAQRGDALLARHRLAAAGVQATAMTVPLTTSHPDGADIRIRVLGRFEVVIGGQPVPPAAWQSRKARDLLRILVSRRGRLIPREELAELLWPDIDAARTAHRLSVLLSIVRAVLDPARSAPAPLAGSASASVILANRAAVALDPLGVRVDVDDFLAEVGHGCGLYEQGHASAARALLRAALAGYAGDPFDDEPYADWTAPVREQARWAYLRAHRTLARLARRAADPDDATGHLLAILERDPYDEEAHQLLIRTLTEAGRHGEAARARTRYHAALHHIGVPPPPPQ
jgi:DNA-binding SARP family transcriptional activator/ATP/maltotriose-dependent transcriptional regulator MalT